MDEKQTRDWMYFEALFHKITKWLLGLSAIFLTVTVVLQEEIGKIVDLFIIPILVFYVGSIAIFLISIIRIFKFSLSRNKEADDTVTKTVVNLLLSPITFIIANILLFMVALSSCSVS